MQNSYDNSFTLKKKTHYTGQIYRHLVFFPHRIGTARYIPNEKGTNTFLLHISAMNNE